MASVEDSLKVSRKTFLPEQIELRLDGLIKPKGGRQGKKRKSDASAGARVATPARKKYKAAGATSGPLAKGATAPTTPASEKRKPGRPPKAKSAEAKKAESTSERRRSGRATTKVKYVESGPSSDEEEVASYSGDDSGDEDVEMEDAGSENDDVAKEKGSVRRVGRRARPVEKEEEAEDEEGEKERSASPTPGMKDKEATEPMDEDQEKEKKGNDGPLEAAESGKVEEVEEVVEKEGEPEEKLERPPSPKPKITPMKRGRGRPKRQPPPEPALPELPIVTKAKDKTPERKPTRGTRRTRATAGINGSATNGNAKAKTVATGNEDREEDSSELSEPPSDIEVS